MPRGLWKELGRWTARRYFGAPGSVKDWLVFSTRGKGPARRGPDRFMGAIIRRVNESGEAFFGDQLARPAHDAGERLELASVGG